MTLGLAARQHVLKGLWWDHQTKAHAHIEGVPEVGLRHLPLLLKPAEQGGTLPAAGIHPGVHPGGQAAGQIFRQASAGDVGHAADGGPLGQQALHQGGVEAGGGQQAGDHGSPIAAEPGFGCGFAGFEDAAHQAEAVAVHPTAGHGHDAVARHNLTAIDQLVGLDHGHAETGQVVAAFTVITRHLCRFAPQQGAAALAAALGDALHHLGHRLGYEPTGGDVVEKEEGGGSAGDHIVHAHRHQVDAHAVVNALGLGQVELGAHPIGAGHQQGVAQTGGQAAKPPEAAKPPHHLRPAGGVHAGADSLHKGTTGDDIHAGTAVIHGIRPC